jgi:hypothetical protein
MNAVNPMHIIATRIEGGVASQSQQSKIPKGLDIVASMRISRIAAGINPAKVIKSLVRGFSIANSLFFALRLHL